MQQKIFYLVVFFVFSQSTVFLNASEMHATNQLTWKVQQLPGSPSLRATSVYGGTLWVAGTQGKIFKSLDEGNSWIDISLNDQTLDIRDIEVFDQNTAIAMSAGDGKQSNLFKTINGGKTWFVLLTNQDKKGFYDSIDFWNNNTGLLLGDPVDGYFVILKTDNAGQSWHRIKSNNLPSPKPKEIAFAASGNTLITGPDGQAWVSLGGFSAAVYYSRDFGETWVRQSVPLYNKTATSGAYALSLNQDFDIFVLGGDYQNRPGAYLNVARFNKTKGKWVVVDNNRSGLRTAMTCLQAICIATGKTASDISTDMGHSWTHFSEEGFYTLASSGSLILAAGHDGRVATIKL